MYARLPRLEIYFYIIICFYFIIILLLNVYNSGNYFINHLGSDPSIVPGSSWFNRMRDSSDGEWMHWTIFLSKAFPWLLVHSFISEIIRFSYKPVLPFFYIFVTISFFISYVSIKILSFIILQTVFFYFVSFLNSRIIIWITAVIIMFLHKADYVCLELTEHHCFLVDISLSWLTLKCVDYTFSNVGKEKSIKDFIYFHAYAFYFPSFFFGPFIPFDDFFCGFLKDYPKLTFSRLKALIFGLLRYSFWATIVETASHYLYCNALHFHLYSEIFNNVWTFNGVGLCMGQFFYLKYLVIYGSAGCIAKFEGHNPPPPPVCVNRIHLYSKMWRYFDRGYYLFIFKNIYKPVCGSYNCSTKRKLFSSFLSFCFVILWHGLNYTIFFWSLFNFIGISFEAVGKHISSGSTYAKFESLCGTPQIQRRVTCLLFAPLWILAIFSNYFFFGGTEYGFRCFQQFADNGWGLLALTYFVAYAVCQVSVELENSSHLTYTSNAFNEIHSVTEKKNS